MINQKSKIVVVPDVEGTTDTLLEQRGTEEKRLYNSNLLMFIRLKTEKKWQETDQSRLR